MNLHLTPLHTAMPNNHLVGLIHHNISFYAFQVASRVQKYFIKLTKAGIPVPGRTPNLCMYTKKVFIKALNNSVSYIILHLSTAVFKGKLYISCMPFI